MHKIKRLKHCIKTNGKNVEIMEINGPSCLFIELILVKELCIYKKITY